MSSVDRKRSRSLLRLRDLDIEGATAMRLIAAFGDIDAILDASSEELLAVSGVGEATVRKIERARSPLEVRVPIDEGTVVSIERQLETDDTDEESVAEWIHGAIRQRAIREFCK